LTREPGKGIQAMTDLAKRPAPRNSAVILPPQDSTAIAIGNLYRKGKSSMVDSVRYLVEAGQRLAAKKDSLARIEYLLAELRCASLRARLWQADIDAVGLALKAALVEPEQALELLADCDCLKLIEPKELEQ
jgi:hypothetical protein